MSLVFIRCGALAEIRIAESPLKLKRGNRVLVRTDRGVELATAMGPARHRTATGDPHLATAAARVLRTTTDEDEQLIRRLRRHRRRAVERCREALARAGSAATLIDVDQIFDGGTLVLHFLGEVNDQDQRLTEQIVAEYESVARTAEFAKLLRDGCGPDCGTGNATGCDTCTGCAAGNGSKPLAQRANRP